MSPHGVVPYGKVGGARTSRPVSLARLHPLPVPAAPGATAVALSVVTVSWPVFVVAIVGSMAGLAYAMRDLPIGTAYAVWVGIGAVLTVVYAMATGGESASMLKVMFLVMIIGGVVGLGLFMLVYLMSRGHLGMGDVKLAGLIGLMLGYPAVISALVVGIILGAGAAIVLLVSKRATRKSTMAYAPYLALGALFVMWLYW